jgi:hypothetical protein
MASVFLQILHFIRCKGWLHLAHLWFGSLLTLRVTGYALDLEVAATFAVLAF